MSESVTWDTVRSYLSALRFYQIAAGLPDPSMSSFPRLNYILKGVHKKSPEHKRAKRLPITPDLLRRIHSVWSQTPLTYDKVMLWAAYCLGFFGFLRAGEFTSTLPPPPGGSILSVADITIDSRDNPQVLTVLLRTSKTDTFGMGTRLYLGRTGKSLCPVAAMLGYLAIHPSNPGPLFIWENGTPLSRAQLVKHLQEVLTQAGIDTTHFSGHSFRIGAASTVARMGFSDSFIQTLGRWKSSAFMSYIRTPVDQLISVSTRLATP